MLGLILTAALCGDPAQIGHTPKAFEIVYVSDGNKTRKLIRREQPNGEFGQWLEHFCEGPRTTAFQYRSSRWPRSIQTTDVKRLLGEKRFDYFRKNRDATASRTHNFTGKPYRKLGG